MDSFNKVISFVLGLVVVLVFFAVVTGKLNLTGKPSSTTASKTNSFFNFGKTSPTQTPTPTKKPPSIVIIDTNGNQIPKSIPSTGLPTLFIPTLLSGLIGGNFLRKAGKK
ncbi:MAG: hypothetical protein AAB437_02005 [Patescibacteria group bacterium]